MYNRYVRNDGGSYSRVAQQDAADTPPHDYARPRENPPPPPPPKHNAPPEPPPEEAEHRAPETKFLDRILSKLHLGDIDSGDLLLLLILFFLFQEEADEELLIALGLLLIL